MPERLLRGDYVTARATAKLCGTLKAFAQGAAEVHLNTFFLQKAVKAMRRQHGWDGPTHLPPKAITELGQWNRLLRAPLKRSYLHAKPTLTLTTDASSFGWGARISDESGACTDLAGPIPSNMRGEHSTALELFAVERALRQLAPRLQGREVTLKSDCSAVVADLRRARVGSTRLLPVAKKIFALLRTHRIKLTPSWVQGISNQADRLSRLSVQVGPEIRPRAFGKIIELFGTLDVDAFACRGNNRLPRYYSLFPDPQAEAIDFFSAIPSRRDRLFVFPPPLLLGRVLRRLVGIQAYHPVVVVPIWPSRPWWPMWVRMRRAETVLTLDSRDLQHLSRVPEGTRWEVAEIRTDRRE